MTDNVEPLRPTKLNHALRSALVDHDIARSDLITRLYRVARVVDRGTSLDLYQASAELRGAAETARLLAVSVGVHPTQ